MTYLHERLPPLDNPDPSMWVDEAIWGHRFHDEQTPWLVFLEFLNIFVHESSKGRAFREVDGFNTLKYRPARRLELRNILFNNPKLAETSALPTSEDHKWDQWLALMRSAQGLVDPKFSYLREHYQSFEDFADLVSIIQSTSLEVDTNKRWTSKFVFPYGPDCLYEDLNKDASTNDRNFFGRTGELLYLMLCRSSAREALAKALNPMVNGERSKWNKIVQCLQPTDAEDRGSDLAKSFLPYPKHQSYDLLSEDWLGILSLDMPGFDSFPHLVNLAGLHLVKYQLTVARDIISSSMPYCMVCEVVAPKKTLVREVSCDIYQANNLLSAQAVMAYIDNIELSPEWQAAKGQPGAFAKCRDFLERQVLWGADYDGTTDPDSLMVEFKTAAKRRHHQHIANIHRNYGRLIGLVSKRGTNKLRYAPSDEFLKTLILVAVNRRMEFGLFLSRVFERYGLVFGEKEAQLVLPQGEFEMKPFQANAKRLEQRLASLGLLKRLSDGCAYVLNPYSQRSK